MNISALSTKTHEGDRLKLNLRDENAIERLVHFVMHGNTSMRTLFSFSIGFENSTHPDSIIDEIIRLQFLYKKTSGIRIRGEIVEILKSELTPGQELPQIRSISQNYGSYFFFSGFQVVCGVFDKGSKFEIWYVLNAVSYGDGAKYHHNDLDVYDEQMSCLRATCWDVTGNGQQSEFDFDTLEYY